MRPRELRRLCQGRLNGDADKSHASRLAWHVGEGCSKGSIWLKYGDWGSGEVEEEYILRGLPRTFDRFLMIEALQRHDDQWRSTDDGEELVTIHAEIARLGRDWTLFSWNDLAAEARRRGTESLRRDHRHKTRATQITLATRLVQDDLRIRLQNEGKRHDPANNTASRHKINWNLEPIQSVVDELTRRCHFEEMLARFDRPTSQKVFEMMLDANQPSFVARLMLYDNMNEIGINDVHGSDKKGLWVGGVSSEVLTIAAHGEYLPERATVGNVNLHENVILHDKFLASMK